MGRVCDFPSAISRVPMLFSSETNFACRVFSLLDVQASCAVWDSTFDSVGDELLPASSLAKSALGLLRWVNGISTLTPPVAPFIPNTSDFSSFTPSKVPI